MQALSSQCPLCFKNKKLSLILPSVRKILNFRPPQKRLGISPEAAPFGGWGALFYLVNIERSLLIYIIVEPVGI